jgi:cell wall-associated NlpC family hydrolase
MSRILPRLSGAHRTAFIAAARSLLGVRYRHQGRTARGVDCVGLCIYGLAQIGIQCEDMFGYDTRPDGVTLQANVEKHLGPPTDNWKPGDIVLFRWHEKNGTVYSNHVGILSGVTPYSPKRWTLLHSYGPEKRVTEHTLAAPWDRRVVAVYSLAGEAA